jgi:TRAP-type C4-dicarboxylate transport system permease small subunit
MSESQISTIITVLIRTAQMSIFGFLALIGWMGWQVSRREASKVNAGTQGAYVPRMLRTHQRLFPASRLRQTALVVVALCVSCLLSSYVLIRQQRKRLTTEVQAINALQQGEPR